MSEPLTDEATQKRRDLHSLLEKVGVILVMGILFFGTVFVSHIYLSRSIPVWALMSMIVIVGFLAAATVLTRSEWLHKTVLLFYVIVPFLCLLWGIILLWNRYVFATDIILLITFYTLTMLGVGVGYHRMLTHHGFDASPLVRFFWIVLGIMSFNGTPLFWAATHIKHHAHSDDEDDPHSPLHGFWHAHFGWLYSLCTTEVKAEEYAPHLLQDRVVVFANQTAGIWMLLSLLISFLIGGWTGLLWGGAVRIFLMNHVGWSTNSICHCFGKRTFDTTDESRNNWLLAILDFGEGWHNNHHAFPTNAFHGMRWWQVDLSGLVIRTMEWMGLVWNVQRVSREAEAMHIIIAARSQSALQSLRMKLMHSVDSANAEIQKLCQTSIESVDHDSLQKQLHESMQTLSKIRSTIVSSFHLKRPKLAAYQKQVELVLEQAKKAVLRFRTA